MFQSYNAPDDAYLNHRNNYLFVCAECLRASCWMGIFMCEDSRDANIRVITRKKALSLEREHTDYIDDPIVHATEAEYLIPPTRAELEDDE